MSHKKKNTFARRTLLKGLGLTAGAGLLAPLMQSAWAEACFDSAPVPRRFVIVMQGNGIEPQNFMSAAAKAARDADRDNEVTLAIDDLTGSASNTLRAIQGDGSQLDLTPHAVVMHRLSSKIAGGGHTSQYKALSCSKGRAETFDNWLARTLHTTQPFDALRLGVMESKTAKLQYNISISESGRQLPIIANPVDGHSTLFGSIAAGAGGKEFATQREILDFAHQDITIALNAFAGSSRERLKLEAYLASLEELREQQDRLISSSDCLRDLAITQGFDPDTGEPLGHDHPLERLKEQFRLGTAALLGNLTNVVMITNSVGNAFSHTKYTSLRAIFEEDSDFSGTIPWRHGVAHRDAASREVCQKVLDRVIETQVEQVARMARTLASVPEGSGTMLDHTAIVLMSDNGSSHHSESTDWPTLLVGGSALGLKTQGRSLLFPGLGKSNHKRMSNLFDTLASVARPDLDFDTWQWGKEPEKAQHGGPLSELLA